MQASPRLRRVLVRRQSTWTTAPTGFKLFAGYRFNKCFGLEGAYHNFGDFDEDLDPPNPGGDAKAE